jgi:hypothetical protein
MLLMNYNSVGCRVSKRLLTLAVFQFTSSPQPLDRQDVSAEGSVLMDPQYE